MNRFELAKVAQGGACNPIPLSRGLQQAIYEVRDAGGDTNAILNDAACRLVVHQLAHLFRIVEIDTSLGEYARLLEEVEQGCGEPKN